MNLQTMKSSPATLKGGALCPRALRSKLIRVADPWQDGRRRRSERPKSGPQAREEDRGLCESPCQIVRRPSGTKGAVRLPGSRPLPWGPEPANCGMGEPRREPRETPKASSRRLDHEGADESTLARALSIGNFTRLEARTRAGDPREGRHLGGTEG